VGDNTPIQWTDATWSPVRARVKEDAGAIAEAKGYTSLVQIATKMAGHVGPHCEHVSPGCENCYSEANGCRCLPANGTGLPFDRRSTDLVDIFLDENIRLQPLRWKRGRKIFVCSQTDLFGEFVPDELIDRVFAAMAICPQHTFQVLTKRADRMSQYISSAQDRLQARFYLDRCAPVKRIAAVKLARSLTRAESREPLPWPLPNVWLGVSAENQEWADKRIPSLLRTPAAKRFISAEPLLGPIDLQNVYEGTTGRSALHVKASAWNGLSALPEQHVDWVICGGESGPGARPMHPDWARWLRDQCVASNVAFHFKQWGAWEPIPHWIPARPTKDQIAIDLEGSYVDDEVNPDDVGGQRFARVGKKAAGRVLDGCTWDEFPMAAQNA
jgi:protein gp37